MKLRETVRATMIVLAFEVVAIFAGACRTEKTGTIPPSQATPPDQTKLADNEAGREAFLAYCAMCHGVWGEGDGPMAPQLEKLAGVRPAELNDPVRLASLGRAQLIQIITLGGGRTHRSNLMPPWGQKLQPKVIEQIADYVMSLPTLKPGIPRGTVEAYLKAPPGAPDDGRKVFVFYCTMCHGPYGKGNGILADSLWAQHQIRPRDLTDSLYFASKTDQEIFVTVSLGGEYTGHSRFMPGWGGIRLTPAEIKDLVSYIRAISRTQSRP
jgi:mono/diheme cytochrome c family protein